MKPAELERYARHLALAEIGMEGQVKLKAARVLVIGAGGLGCPVLQYLAAAGVGKIGIADGDTVTLSNLHRQVLYGPEDTGKMKAELAASRISRQNDLINIVVINEVIGSSNALDILKDWDVIVDATDNLESRYCINDACVILGKPDVYGSVLKFEGQVSVFNYRNGPTYRCLFPEPPSPGTIPSCAEAGVLGVLPGITGAIQASEVIKIITGAGEPLSGSLLVLDSLAMKTTTIRFERDEKQVERILAMKEDFRKQDYSLFCGIMTLKEITPNELREKIKRGDAFQLIDVREPYEYEQANLKGELIPMGEIMLNTDKIARDKPVIVHCRTGRRSASVIMMLQDSLGLDNLYNLKGGIVEWAATEE